MEGDSNKDSANKDDPFSNVNTVNEEYMTTNTNTFENTEKYAKTKSLNTDEKDNEPIPTEEIDYFAKTDTIETVAENNEFEEKNTITETTYQNVDTLNNGEFTYTETIQKPDSGYVNNEGVNEEITTGNDGLVSSSPLSKQDLKNIGSYLNKIVNFNNYSNTGSTNVDTNQNNNADLVSSETGGINTNDNNNVVQPSTTGESTPIINDYSNFNYYNQKSSSASNIQTENNNQFSQEYNNMESLFPPNEYQSVNINQPTTETNTGINMGELSLNEVNNALYENTNIKTEYPLNEYTGTDVSNKNTQIDSSTKNEGTMTEIPQTETNQALSENTTNTKKEMPLNEYTVTDLTNENVQENIINEIGTTTTDYPLADFNIPSSENITNINTEEVPFTEYTNTNYSSGNNRPTIRKENGATIVEYPPVEIGHPFENITGVSTTKQTTTTTTSITDVSVPEYKTYTYTNFSNRPTIRKENGATIVEYPPVEVGHPFENITGVSTTKQTTTTTTTNFTDVSVPEYKTYTYTNFNNRPTIRKENGATIVEYPPVEVGHPFENITGVSTTKQTTTTTTNFTDVSVPEYKTYTYTNFNNRPNIRKENGATIIEYPPVEIGHPFENIVGVSTSVTTETHENITEVPLSEYTTTNYTTENNQNFEVGEPFSEYSVTNLINENTQVSTVDKVVPLTDYVSTNTEIQTTPLTDDYSLTKLENELFNTNTSVQFELPKTDTFTQEVQSTQNLEQQIPLFDVSKENTEVYMPENQVTSTITTDVFSYESKENKNVDLTNEDLTQIPSMAKTIKLKTEVKDSKILKESSVVDNPLPTITRNPITVKEKKENPVINMPLKTQPTITRNLGTSYVDDTQNKGLAKSYTTYSNPTQTLFKSQTITSNNIKNINISTNTNINTNTNSNVKNNSNNSSKVNESKVQDKKLKKSKTVVVNNTTLTKSQK